MTDPIRAVLFDLGNTLVYLDTPWAEIYEANVKHIYEYLKNAGLRAEFEKFAITFVRAFENASADANVYKIEISMQEIIGKVLGKFGVKDPNLGFIQGAMEAYYQPELHSWQLYPDAFESLLTLEKQGYLLGIISNYKSDWFIRAVLQRLEIAKFFKHIFTSAALGIRKPRSGIFLEALSAMNSRPSETVFIGDSLDADVIGARNVGMHAIYLRRNPSERTVIVVDPEATVSDLTEAIKVVNEWKRASSLSESLT
jgi:HAD superfamily hydrolase (TIGR01662 family)